MTETSASTGPEADGHASDAPKFAGTPPRLVVCLDMTSVDWPDGTTGTDGLFPEHTLDVNDPKSVQTVLEYVDERIHGGIDDAWEGPAGKLDGWGSDPDEEKWARAFTEVFFGLRYGGPGQAYFSNSKWDSFIFSRIQPASVDYFDPAIYGLAKPDKPKPGTQPKAPSPPATFLETTKYAAQLAKDGKTIDSAMKENDDPAYSLATACQHLTTYGALSRGFTLEHHLDGSNFAAAQNDSKKLFKEEKGKPIFPGAKWYKTDPKLLDVPQALALDPPVGPGSIYCYNPFGDSKWFLVWVPPHYTEMKGGKRVVSDPYVEEVANGRFEKKPKFDQRMKQVDDQTAGESSVQPAETNQSGGDEEGAFVEALLPARGQRKGSHIMFVLRVSDDKKKLQRFDTSNTGAKAEGLRFVESMPGMAGIYDGPDQVKIAPTAGYESASGKFCGVGVLGTPPPVTAAQPGNNATSAVVGAAVGAASGPMAGEAASAATASALPSGLGDQADFLRKARPVGLLRFVLTERVPTDKMGEQHVLFASRLFRMYGDGDDDNFWVSKCAWSLRNTPGFTNLQPWWIIYIPRNELAIFMWQQGMRQMGLRELAAHAFALKTAKFEQQPPVDSTRPGATKPKPPEPGLTYNADFVDAIVLTSDERGQAVYWCRKRANLSYGATSEGTEGQGIPAAIKALVAPTKGTGLAWDGEKAGDRLINPDTNGVDFDVPSFFRDGEEGGEVTQPVLPVGDTVERMLMAEYGEAPAEEAVSRAEPIGDDEAAAVGQGAAPSAAG